MTLFTVVKNPKILKLLGLEDLQLCQVKAQPKFTRPSFENLYRL
jgi:hypothetical protein